MYQTLASLVDDLIANSDASSDDNDDDANDAFNISTTTTSGIGNLCHFTHDSTFDLNICAFTLTLLKGKIRFLFLEI